MGRRWIIPLERTRTGAHGGATESDDGGASDPARIAGAQRARKRANRFPNSTFSWGAAEPAARAAS